MHQQCPRAPEKEDHRAEQVPEHLGSAGERQRGQLMEHIADAVRQPPRDGGEIPARAHHGIFGGKAQRIQGLAHPQHQSAPRSFFERSFMRRCVFRRKRCFRSSRLHWSCAQRDRSVRLCFTGGADGASCIGSFVFSSIKRGCSFLTVRIKNHKFISIIHAVRAETRFLTKIGQTFHGLFT